MPKDVMERTIPDVRTLSAVDLPTIVHKSGNVVAEMGPKIQWRSQVLGRIRLRLRKIPLFVRLASPIFVLCTLLIVIVELASHRGLTLTISDPPAALLPGKPEFPTKAPCIRDARLFCHLNQNGIKIQVNLSPDSPGILSTFVEIPDKTLGDLIAAWGAPTYYFRSEVAVTVFWSARAAQLAPYSFEPSTRVLYLAYGETPQQRQPWRGFVNQTFSR